MPDYTLDPRLLKVPFMALKKAIIAKVGRRQEDKDAVFHSSTKFALAELATRYNIDITDVLNSVGPLQGFEAREAREAEARAAAASMNELLAAYPEDDDPRLSRRSSEASVRESGWIATRLYEMENSAGVPKRLSGMGGIATKLYEMEYGESAPDFQVDDEVGAPLPLSAATLANSMRVLMTPRQAEPIGEWTTHAWLDSLVDGLVDGLAPALLPPPGESALAYASGLSAPQIEWLLHKGNVLETLAAVIAQGAKHLGEEPTSARSQGGEAHSMSGTLGSHAARHSSSSAARAAESLLLGAELDLLPTELRARIEAAMQERDAEIARLYGEVERLTVENEQLRSAASRKKEEHGAAALPLELDTFVPSPRVRVGVQISESGHAVCRLRILQ